MLKIGMDKTDRTFQHFEYDDERKYGIVNLIFIRKEYLIQMIQIVVI